MEWLLRSLWDASDPRPVAMSCYFFLAKPVSEEEGDEQMDSENELEYECYRINEALYCMIKDSRSEHPAHVQNSRRGRRSRRVPPPFASRAPLYRFRCLGIGVLTERLEQSCGIEANWFSRRAQGRGA